MANFSITMKMTPNHSRKLRAFNKQLPKNIRVALKEIGRLIWERASSNVAGAGFSRNKGRSSKYPGVGKTGNLRAGLNSVLEPDGMAVGVGTHVEYDKYVIPISKGGLYKGTNITKHFLVDSMEEKRKQIVQAMSGKVFRPIRRR